VTAIYRALISFGKGWSMPDEDRRLTLHFCQTSASALQAAAAVFGGMIINNDLRLGARHRPQADRDKQKNQG
jgi:hypothetical protein